MIKISADCCGCSACAAACPKNCISMKQDGEGFYRPHINKALCVNCGLCERACPLKAPARAVKAMAYGAISTDGNVRRKSSSGGVFSLLAREVGGVVFGAAFDKGFDVAHKAAGDPAEFRGSKYVQSNMGDCFREAKKLLDEGRPVYFSGTPCQIAGLKSYLKGDHPLLFTQDIICHSTPSPMVWRAFIEEKEKEYGGVLSYASFREKEDGVPGYKLKMVFDNGNSCALDGNNPYTAAFIGGYTCSKACVACSFKGDNRHSDITLGDFWGVEGCLPGFDDGGGVSLVLINSQKGKEYFERIRDRLTVKEADLDRALRGNPRALKAIEPNPKRERFLKDVAKQGFNTAVENMKKTPLILRIKWKLKRLFR